MSDELELTEEQKAVKELRDKAVWNIDFYTKALAESKLQLRIIDAGVASIEGNRK